jgi:acyl dehydratase
MSLPSMNVGDELPVLERLLGAADLVAYAGATWDWNRLHYDHDYLTERGLPGPVVDGQMFGALLVEQVQDWLGPQARVTAMGFRYAAMVFAGETVTVLGEVESIEDGVVRVRQRIESSGEADSGQGAKLAIKDAWIEAVLG